MTDLRRRWQRYRERLGDEREAHFGPWTVTLERWPIRSRVDVRCFGRLIRHWVRRDSEAEAIWTCAVGIVGAEPELGALRVVDRLDAIDPG